MTMANHMGTHCETVVCSSLWCFMTAAQHMHDNLHKIMQHLCCLLQVPQALGRPVTSASLAICMTHLRLDCHLQRHGLESQGNSAGSNLTY